MLSKELEFQIKNCEDYGHSDIYLDLNYAKELLELIKKYYHMLDRIKTGELSDGYHTYNELYYHRAVLFSVICNNHKDIAYKSKKHHDGTMYDGMFIIGIKTPQGQYSYHYDLNMWSMFDVPELEFAPEWDGHQASDIDRLRSIPQVQSTDKALDRAVRMIDDLTGSCPLDMYDCECDCENCDNNSKKCWRKYFENVTDNV